MGAVKAKTATVAKIFIVGGVLAVAAAVLHSKLKI